MHLWIVLPSFFFGVWPFSSSEPKEKPIRTQHQEVKVEKILEGRNVIWGMEFIHQDRILFTERNGKMGIYDLGKSQYTELHGVPSIAIGGQGGLLDVKLHPDFGKNQKIIFAYAHLENGLRTTRIAQARLDGDQLKDLKVVFTANPLGSPTIHFGSRIVFDRDQNVFFSVGDRGDRYAAQDLESDLGKIHRITFDGSIPKDNPFTRKNGKKSSVWSYGHRNPQGLFYDDSTGTLWEQEHGPQGGDEINRIERGKNYGWPVITYGREYHGPKIGEGARKEGMEQPVKEFTPSIAPSGLLIYRGHAFKAWRGDFFSGALKLQHLNRVRIRENKALEEERLFTDLGERIRDIEEGPDGNLYFSTDSGKIFRVRNSMSK